MFRRYRHAERQTEEVQNTEVHSDRMPVGSIETNIAHKQTYLRTNR
jgi:hypothetical protein